MTRRPHRVFVFDVGPSFSFATAERAHERAAALLDEYARVSVWDADEILRGGPGTPMTRTLYRHDREPERQQFTGDGWGRID